jgi:hypothetical protein
VRSLSAEGDTLPLGRLEANWGRLAELRRFSYGYPVALLSKDFLTGILWQWFVALVLTIFKMSLRFIGNSLA